MSLVGQPVLLVPTNLLEQLLHLVHTLLHVFNITIEASDEMSPNAQVKDQPDWVEALLKRGHNVA